MSHEGIRIVAEDAAGNAERELPHEAIQPQNVRVHQTEGTGIEITWKDGHL